MTEEFKYRPPIKNLLIGFCGLVMAAFFGLAIIKGNEIWFSIVVGIFCLKTVI
jgi:hypothetical protein